MSDFFEEVLNGGLNSLSMDQLDQLIIMAQAKRSEGLIGQDPSENSIPTHCPSGHTSIRKHGTTAAGTPRMLCTTCKKAFTYGAGSNSQNNRLTDYQLTALYIGIIENTPIGKLADRLNISRAAVAKQKLKVMNIIYQNFYSRITAVDESGNPIFKFDNETQCDEWFCRVSFKGKRDPEFFIFTLRRFPRHNYSHEEQIEYLQKHNLYERVMAIPGYLDELRHNTKHIPSGISKQQVCIVVAVDENRNLVAKPVSVGELESKEVRKLLSGHFRDGSTFVTDDKKAYCTLSKKNNINHVGVNSKIRTNGEYNLGHVNGVHSEIEKYIPESRQQIPSTKYVHLYMAMFTWIWVHKNLSLDEKVLLLRRTIAQYSKEYDEPYETIKRKPLDINTKGQFPNVV